MRATDIIMRKRQGEELTREELRFLVSGYVDGSIPEYQVSAWLMAVFFKGMSSEEAGVLTREMIESGESFDLSSLTGPFVDKHSTGGVGDKVSLILAPVAAACGLQVPMMSGRGLGHTGGTLDKLETIPGYSTAMDQDRFRSIISDVGYAMTGQSERIVPADRKLYALRDVTATVESVPLITSSILSKKFAEGADALVFDVKCGSGAFMKTEDEARRLAESLLYTGQALGKQIACVLTRMEEPLGRMVGNFLEVEESVYCLRPALAPDGWKEPADLMEVTLRLAAWMLKLGGKAGSVEKGEALARKALESGNAWEVFRRNVEAQGGDVQEMMKGLGVRRGSVQRHVTARADGVIETIDAYKTGLSTVYLGAGRSKAEDDVLPNVGIEFHLKSGDAVSAGQQICTIYGESPEGVEAAAEVMESAIAVGNRVPDAVAMIITEISE